MRLHGCHDGRLYASEGRTVLRETDSLSFEPIGKLPVPGDGLERIGRYLTTGRPVKPLLERFVGDFATATVRPLTREDLVATVGRWILTSHDGGRQWHIRRRLPASSPPFGVLPSAICYHDATLYVGEYPTSPTAPPNLLRSDDLGRTWTATEIPGVRHVHAVQRDPHDGSLWLTTGDADAECSIGRLVDGVFTPIGGGSQRWRAVELAFTPSAVLWGMDCLYADRNHLFRLDRTAFEDTDHDELSPERVHSVGGSVFYSGVLDRDGETLVAFSTAAESGTDSTAPLETSEGTSEATIVASSSSSDFTDWNEIRQYRRRRSIADHVPGNRIPTANAYVYLVAASDRGLFVNPYNTASENGTIELIPPSSLRP